MKREIYKVLAIVLAIILFIGFVTQIPDVFEIINSHNRMPYKIGYIMGSLLLGVATFFLLRFGFKK